MSDQADLPDVIRTSSPLVYAANTNFILSIVCCPKELRDSKYKETCITEWWWRFNALLFALVVSFWTMYLGYMNNRITLNSPSSTFLRWEEIPLDSIYRNKDIFPCWSSTACISRYKYCYILNYNVENCLQEDLNGQKVLHSEGGAWCDADCSDFQNRTRGACGCLDSHGTGISPYKHPEPKSPCYLDEGVSVKVCTNHTDCGTDYCASCEKCMKGGNPEFCAPHCSLNISATCDPSELCSEGKDSIDGMCPNNQVKNDHCPKGGARSDPLIYSGYSRPFCPNAEINDQCLDYGSKSPYMWSFVAGLFAMVSVTFFEICRKSYLRITTPVDADVQCSNCQIVQLIGVDVLIPILLITAIFATSLTRSYPMVLASEGANCFTVSGSKNCTALTLTKNSLLNFWILAWFFAANLQIIKSIFQFYLLRRMLPSEYSSVPLDLRRYVVVPDSPMDEGTFENTSDSKKKEEKGNNSESKKEGKNGNNGKDVTIQSGEKGDTKQCEGKAVTENNEQLTVQQKANTKKENSSLDSEKNSPSKENSSTDSKIEKKINVLDVILSIILIVGCFLLAICSIMYAMPK